MEIYSIEKLKNREYSEISMVKGSVIMSRHIGSDFAAGLKQIVGGEIKGYSKMLESARTTATERMVEEARGLGADAVVGVRFSTSAIMAGAAEVLIYGTAVKYIG
ncbi:MAG: YbjQ family protein [Spirochaetales bacterium]|nr:YbjQ family protein [Spirochaetales bacterium]